MLMVTTTRTMRERGVEPVLDGEGGVGPRRAAAAGAGRRSGRLLLRPVLGLLARRLLPLGLLALGLALAFSLSSSFALLA